MVAEVRVDVRQLAERVRTVADALKAPRNPVVSEEEWAALCEEVRAVAAELRGDGRRHQLVSEAAYRGGF